MSTRDIRGHLEELYGVEVSPELISKSLTPSSKTLPGGASGLWRRSGRSSTWTRWSFVSERAVACDVSLRTWPSASTSKVRRKYWACGSVPFRHAGPDCVGPLALPASRGERTQAASPLVIHCRAKHSDGGMGWPRCRSYRRATVPCLAAASSRPAAVESRFSGET